MSEIEKTLLELENLIEYRHKMLPGDEHEDILGLGLTSRKNLCINEEVNSTKSGKLVDEKCRLKTNGELKGFLLPKVKVKRQATHCVSSMKTCTNMMCMTTFQREFTLLKS